MASSELMRTSLYAGGTSQQEIKTAPDAIDPGRFL